MRGAWLERTLDGLDWVARTRGRMENLPKHLMTGIEGEDAVFHYLRGKGYTVVARRWSSGDAPGDVDLIAWQGDLLCFIEVKTRTARDMTPAQAAVDSHKRQILRRLARRYLRLLPAEKAPQVRFDVVSVYRIAGQPTEMEHYEAAFGWDARRA